MADAVVGVILACGSEVLPNNHVYRFCARQRKNDTQKW
jgi:hypothetical protein